MLFSSMTFLWVFLPIVFLICVILPKRFRNVFLLLASLLFYAWGEPVYIVLMLISIVMNWGFGLAIEKFPEKKTLLLVLDITLNLMILGYYKYFDFLVGTINSLAGREIFAAREIPLPVGISFFTFQAMSYVIDLYRGNFRAQKSLTSLALYISFFPQLIAGPIVKYKDINDQIESRTMSSEKLTEGLRRFSYGLGKKVLISNILAVYVDKIYGLEVSEISGAAAWIAAVFYTLQIYYDFSGYSDMAIGLGKMLGFEFQENFQYPYLASSIREFWRRWHISLSAWFKEYLYIPLGGNRKGKVRTYLNLLTVFFLTGLWHGASWNYVIWGLYHGLLQILERLGLEKFLKKFHGLGHLYTVLAFTVGWVFFRADNLRDGLRLVKRMVFPWKYPQVQNLVMTGLTREMIFAAVLGVLGCGLIQNLALKNGRCTKLWKNSAPEALFCAAVLVLSFIMLAGDTYNPFIYFRF